MSIRPLFFHVGTGSFGGGSKMLLRLVTSLSESAFDPVILTQKRDQLVVEARNAGVDVELVPFRNPLDTYDHGLFDLSPLQQALAGARILQFNVEARSVLAGADIIWCQNIRALLTVTPYAMFTSSPVVWNIGLGMPSAGIVEYLNELALRICDYVFIESTEQAQKLFTDSQFDRFRNKFVVFHKGIDTKKFSPGNTERVLLENGPNVGTAASLVPRKGLDQFIDAADRIAEREDDVHFYIAGDVPGDYDSTHKETLLELVRERDLEDRITFLGWVEDMAAYFNSLDVFVLASNNEGIPGVVREAMSMKVPVVATDVGGTADAVIDGEVGYLVPPEDAEAIATSVTELLEDGELRTKMGERGRQRVIEEFSLEQYVSSYQTFLSEIHRSES